MFRPAAGRVVQRLATSAVDLPALARSCNGSHLERLVVSAVDCRQTAPSGHGWPSQSSPARGFAAAADDDAEGETREVGNEQVRRLAEEIMQLSLLEVSDLTDILQKRLNIQMPAMGAMGAAPAAAVPAAAPAAEEVKEEPKTEFDIKLTGYDAASKVKVIKEVRTMTSLGLKEAKELVEKAPTVIKAGVKKEEAEELKAKLEAVGGKISLE